MVNLAFSPLLERAVPPAEAAQSRLASGQQAAARTAAVNCTSVLHDQILDYKRKELHELYSCVCALIQLIQAAQDRQIEQVGMLSIAWVTEGVCQVESVQPPRRMSLFQKARRSAQSSASESAVPTVCRSHSSSEKPTV